MFSTLRAEFAWALTYNRRRPVFAVAVALTLAASIGAAATAFGLAETLLWRALPFDNADRLVFAWEEAGRSETAEPSRVTGARYAAWRDTAGAFSSSALFGAAGFTVDGPSGTQAVRAVRVSTGYFETLGIRPLAGRAFEPADGSPGRDRVVVLSAGFWRRHLGAREPIVGQTLRLSGEPYLVIGVMPQVTMPAWPVNPAAVTLDPASVQFWIPIPQSAALDTSSRAHVFGVVARLAPGVSIAAAESRLAATSGPGHADPHGVRLVPLRSQFVADARLVLLVLAAATLAVWLVACANLAALYVSAFESRRHELAVRIAIGGSLVKLVRQLAIESSLLVFVGTTGGLAIAHAALSRLPGLLPASAPLLAEPSLSAPVVAFAAALALLTTVLLTAWPVSRVLAGSVAPRGVAAAPRPLAYRALVVAQVAVTVALGVAAALLGQSLEAVRSRDPGADHRGVLVANVGLTGAESWRDLLAAESDVLAAVRALPRVRAAAIAYDHPLEANWSESPTVTGAEGTADRQLQVELRIVSPGYFEALGVEVLAGRAFGEGDTVDSAGHVVVNEAYARELGGRAVGRTLRSSTPRLTFPEAPEQFAIIGVVSNERVRGLEAPARPAFYLSTRQFPQGSAVLLARISGEPSDVIADVRAAIHRARHGVTFGGVTTLEAVQRDQLATRRLTADVVGGFGLAAIGLAAAGLYGLLSVLVASRTRELGVRMALGATPAAVIRLVVAESFRNTLVGGAMGVLLALAAGYLLRGLLVDVSPYDMATLAAVLSVLLTVAGVAAIRPAKMASRIDPISALKTDH